ncbi:ABC transporter permease subunit [Methylophaga sp. OBS3]|uniref:ABC transporter permease subunit n=1 Tax=Methylophaga sp. OBS3 TaxID=2991934 RepID=UPI00225A35D1|nr:ABC transporter permease subunit [Methylophaga sp. OBS3]MCX4189890.1 ABC transporter permease subunit [Methylophaga sp. OBS3]
MAENTIEKGVIPAADSSVAIRRRRWREMKDKMARFFVTGGGLMVIVAIVLIFFYLLYVVLPLFGGADIRAKKQYEMAAEDVVHVMLDEYNEVGLSLDHDAQLRFFNAQTGDVIATPELPLPTDAGVSSFAAGSLSEGVFAYGFDDGRALMFNESYRISYPEGTTRLITPEIEYPLGQDLVVVDAQGQSLTQLATQFDDDMATFVALTVDNRLVLTRVEKKVNFLDDTQVELTVSHRDLPVSNVKNITSFRMDKDQRDLFVAYNNGDISFLNIQRLNAINLIQTVSAVPEGVDITSMELLAGGISLLVGRSDGQIDQWFPVRDESNNYTLQLIRSFDKQTAPIRRILPEQSRKGFMTLDDNGEVGVYHTTAHRTLMVEDLFENGEAHMALSPRKNGLLVVGNGGNTQFFEVDNKHPEISWHSLWEKVWYENRSGPEYIWQSTSADNNFEPKLSLSPLTFGTIKAAFYAMLVAVPLAIMGAIFTAYFMSPKMRGIVKPTIEIMEALPTVILGFLAGLWLAPLVEGNLPGVFAIFIMTPIMIILVAWLWSRLPQSIRTRIPDGWEAAVLIPVVVLVGFVSMQMSVPLEGLLFDGDMPAWLESVGIGYDQRNSLVVGMVMGFAVIPTIFSITEDAIFSVPKQLTIGSLALGATQWQTLVKVVLLTASPGIFSAVMIGLGRAVGETMIVLMATGNTPIMDFNIFEGFRALSANIAVEMPESEVNSSHYRVLFLAALVLFMATFIFNTIAELVRQRLRNKYSSL